MSRLVVLLGAGAAFATGAAAGFLLAQEDVAENADASSSSVVLVRTKEGGTRELTLAEAAARIERLESLAARARPRAAVPDEEDDAQSPPPSPELEDVPVPKRPDGKTYTALELRDLARTATDPALRLAAIKALRRDDTPEARALLGELVADGATPLAMRIEAAKALAKPPHRDASPEELVTLLASSDLPPDVRREVADGVVRLRDRGAWMQEIAGQMGKEADPEVRKLLFEAVQRSAWDPAAKAELLSVAGNAAASLDERRLAVQALVRQGADKKVIAVLSPLLTNSDAGLRESAVLALARAGRLGLPELGAALADPDASVRAAAFAAKLPGGKNIPKEEREAALATAARLAAGDPEPAVRKAALAWVASMPRDVGAQVLETALNDRDPLVRLEAYGRSPAEVARGQPERIVSQLESPDPLVRDAAYRLVARVWNVDVPYRAGWNPKARAAAVRAIREQVGAAR